ncbi:MAG: hypothetical protein ACLP56_05400 [Candidatus Sulfotelmatobacter sp.]
MRPGPSIPASYLIGNAASTGQLAGLAYVGQQFTFVGTPVPNLRSTTAYVPPWGIIGNIYTVTAVYPDTSCLFQQSGGAGQFSPSVTLSGAFAYGNSPQTVWVGDLASCWSAG